MTKLPDGKTRLDLVREGLVDGGLKKRGRLVVSLSRVLEDPKNERKTFRNLEGLVASIRNVGLIEPITVTLEDGEPAEGRQGSEGREASYRIITGHRRFRAAKAAGLTQVEVLIRAPDDALTRRVKSIISNVQREDVGPIEMAEALQSLMDEDDRIKTQDDLAQLIGKDKTWVSGMLKILSLPVELQEKVGTSQLSVSYDAMIRVARMDDETHQSELVNSIVTGASNRAIRDRIDEIKGKPKTPKAESPTSPKDRFKRVFHTKSNVTIIVQSTTTRLHGDVMIAALKEALSQASGQA